MRTRKLRLLVLLAFVLAAAGAAAARPQEAAAGYVDTQVKQGILLLRGYITTQAVRDQFVYPTRSQVRKGGGLVAPVWPTNPWTGKPMAPGTTRGCYTYTRAADGHGFTLVGHLSSGSYKVTGSSPQWLADERAGAAGDLAAVQEQLTAAQTTITSISDDLTKQNLRELRWWIVTYGRMSGSLPQMADLVTWVDPWPVNPFDGQPMAEGAGPGDLTYVTNTDGSYTLTAHLSSGDFELDQPAADWAAAKNAAILQGVEAIGDAVERVAFDRNGVYPAPEDVRLEGSAGTWVLQWPDNPCTGSRMMGTGSTGDYSYTVAPDGSSCTLTAHLVGGEDYIVSDWTSMVWAAPNIVRGHLMNEVAERAVQVLKEYVEEWKTAHEGAPPTVDQLRSDGAVGAAHSYWPASPWTGTAMEPGTAPGSYEYTLDGSSYTLAVHLLADEHYPELWPAQ